MIDIKVYREYWEGVQKRIPEIKKVLPVTIDEEMSKTIEEVQPVIERIKQMLIEDSATGCPVTKELDLTSLSTLPESGFYRTFAGWSLAFSFKTR